MAVSADACTYPSVKRGLVVAVVTVRALANALPINRALDAAVETTPAGVAIARLTRNLALVSDCATSAAAALRFTTIRTLETALLAVRSELSGFSVASNSTALLEK